MQVKVLGARQGESRHSHFASFLVDGVLALDAGSLTATLTLEEQAAIDNILLTHHHFDHIRDLATFGFNRLGRGQASVYCTNEVLAVARATVLSPQIWIDFFAVPTPKAPTFTHVPVEPERAFSVAGYRVRPIPVRHSLAALGYEVASPSGGTLLYTGDNGPGSGAAWASTCPDLLITEVTFSDAEAESAARFGHLAPSLLASELRLFRDRSGYLPRVAVVHVNPFNVDRVASEVAGVARTLGADIWLPDEGDVIAVTR